MRVGAPLVADPSACVEEGDSYRCPVVTTMRNQAAPVIYPLIVARSSSCAAAGDRAIGLPGWLGTGHSSGGAGGPPIRACMPSANRSPALGMHSPVAGS
jgi:hypothetical protein